MGTEDGWYHQDAFFRVRFRQASCDADCSVCELTNDLITVGDNYEESMITIIDPPTPPTPPITVIETPYTDGGSVGACPSCCSGLGQEDHSVEWITSQDDPMGNMTATATVILQEATTFDLLWSAVAEDQYETLTITVNGVVKTQFTAKSDGVCAVSTCVMCVIKEQSQQIQLKAGTNIITVDTTTEDGWYHQDAFFRVRFRQASCDADCSVCELTNELITVGDKDEETMIIDYSFPEVIEVATTSSPVEAPPIGWPCPVEEGFCVKQDGGDQNDGVIKINNMDGNTEEAQKECLQACLNHEGATGCEVIWDQGNRGCYIHTDIIHHGNGVGNHLCWLFTPENDFSTCLLTDGGKDNTPETTDG